jgi:glycosyltransferase involved in cell wall biosynthesis
MIQGSMNKINDKPLRILMPSYRSHPYTGGQGIYMRLVTKAMIDLGHTVEVLSGQPYPILDKGVGLTKLPSLDLYSYDSPLEAFRLSLLREPINLYEWLSHLSGGFSEPYTFGERMAVWGKKNYKNFDVVHDNQTLAYGLLKLKKLGLPVVGTIHHPITMDKRIDIKHADTISLKILKWRWYSFLKMQIRVARKLDPIIVVSENTRKDLIKDFKIDTKKTRKVLHGIDHETFQPIPSIKRKANQLITTASADVPLKGLIYLIRAYAGLLKEFPDLKLIVIGRLREGPTEKELKKEGIKEKVKFVSNLTGRQIAELYAESTIAVSPSVYEGFGFPAGEAMSCGIPLVSTNGGSLPEVVGDAGIIVPHSDPKALKDAIKSLLNSPEIRIEFGKKGRRRVLENFTWNRAAKELVEVYREAIENANNRP